LATAATYDALNDFSLSSNPNGAWSYGTLSSFTGGTFAPFTVASSDVNYSGQQLWWNGGSFPNAAAVDKNTSGSTVSFFTIVQPTDMLRLDGENFIADVRWTAPASSFYDVAGLFQRIDNAPQPVNVRIVQDSTTVLFAVDAFTGFNNQQPFNLANLFLPAGTTLDFAEGAGQPSFDSTGLKLTITTVPEPSTLVLASLAGLCLCALARRRARIATR
jgi:hypothetical protein